MDQYDQKVKEFKDEFMKEAETLLREFFPRKVIELNDMLKSEAFSELDDFSSMHEAPPLVTSAKPPIDGGPVKKKRKLGDDDEEASVPPPLPPTLIPANKRIGKVIAILKPEIRTLITTCNKVKVWIQLLIPRIEDGNNFGVSIQEDTLSEVTRLESDTSSFLDHVSRYYVARGKLASKLLKYPSVEDYHIALNELDEKQYVALRLTLCEMRNIYSGLHDMIMKNLEKIKTPRTQRVESMY
ncbi:proteasome activator complex subunit 3-like [Oscarella lobularis]|uniref:proteasome activator complex subunit 3-like n=1 Tax=Oscarella lobularis TaxID=121494 RepID=UPI0033132BEA